MAWFKLGNHGDYGARVQKARDLYVKTFGFVPIFDATDPAHPEELVTTRLRYRGANILLVKNGFDYDGKALASTDALPPTLFYIYVDDVEGVYQKAKSLGMTSLQAPNITFWGDLRARLQCPFGYIWDIAKKL